MLYMADHWIDFPVAVVETPGFKDTSGVERYV